MPLLSLLTPHVPAWSQEALWGEEGTWLTPLCWGVFTGSLNVLDAVGPRIFSDWVSVCCAGEAFRVPVSPSFGECRSEQPLHIHSRKSLLDRTSNH